MFDLLSPVFKVLNQVVYLNVLLLGKQLRIFKEFLKKTLLVCKLRYLPA